MKVTFMIAMSNMDFNAENHWNKVNVHVVTSTQMLGNSPASCDINMSEGHRAFIHGD